jgi:hypothetical protein
MVNSTASYNKFCDWVQNDLSKDRLLVNRKIFGVVLWCLILPMIMTTLLYMIRKLQLIDLERYTDFFIFLPPLVYVLFSLWPTLRDMPRVFKKGGFVALLEDSQREVKWREETTLRLMSDLKFTQTEWKWLEFHLKNDLDRIRDHNRYLTILAGVVLFFMFQFLDFGSSADIAFDKIEPQIMVRVWIDQFAQWSVQFFSVMVFSSLFYLSGLQFHRHLVRYWVCVQRISLE